MDPPPRNRRQWSDSALLSAIAARDGAAFAVFYRRHLPAVLAFLLRETGDPEAAADLAAEVFAAVLLSAGTPLPNSAVFAAASNTTAVVGYQQLYRTADSGATYTPVTITQSPAADGHVVAWAYLGFTDSTHGIGLGYVGSVDQANERLFYTTDAGRGYHLVPLT